MTNLDRIKKQRHYFLDKGPSSQSYGFSSSHVRMWELDHKIDWTLKNWCFQTMMVEKTLGSPLDCKIKPIHPKGNQPWIFIGRTDAKAEAPMLRPTGAKIRLIGKKPDAGKDKGRWRRGWQRTRWLDGITDLMDVILRQLQKMLKDKEAWHAAVHGGAKSQAQLRTWKTTTFISIGIFICILWKKKILLLRKMLRLINLWMAEPEFITSVHVVLRHFFMAPPSHFHNDLWLFCASLYRSIWNSAWHIVGPQYKWLLVKRSPAQWRAYFHSCLWAPPMEGNRIVHS